MLNEELVRLFISSVHGFNSHHRENPCDSIELQCANLRGIWFCGVDLRGANLRGAILTKADLTDACLAEAGLTGACFGGRVLLDTDFTGAEVTTDQLIHAFPYIPRFSEDEIDELVLEVRVSLTNVSQCSGLDIIIPKIRGLNEKEADQLLNMFRQILNREVRGVHLC